MKHKLFVWVSIGILALVAVLPAMAQDTTTQRTIEVTGVGTGIWYTGYSHCRSGC